MQLTTRRAFSISLLALLAACGSSNKDNKFDRYSGPAVTQIVVQKGKRKMYLMNGSKVLKSYDVSLGTQPVGHKNFEGDGRTPGGLYFIDRFNPRSTYHLSLGVSYPNAQDRAFAAAHGRRPGGDIFIHGRGPYGRNMFAKKRDWTVGCIAVSDWEIEEIYAMIQPGTPILIQA